jgi:hypothetical protein
MINWLGTVESLARVDFPLSSHRFPFPTGFFAGCALYCWQNKLLKVPAYPYPQASAMPATPLDAEITQLEAELRTDPRFARLHLLRQMREAYLRLPPTNDLGGPQRAGRDDDVSAARSTDASRPGRRRSPEREQAIEEARRLLAGRTTPTRLAEINAHLENLGIRLGGSDPLNNLSALLSTCDDFHAHGRAGWTLNGVAT